MQKNLTIDLTTHIYENRQNAIKFAGANNIDVLRALKQLMETRLELSVTTVVVCSKCHLLYKLTENGVLESYIFMKFIQRMR